MKEDGGTINYCCGLSSATECQSLHAFVRYIKKVVTERTALSIIVWSREQSAEAFADNRNLSVLPTLPTHIQMDSMSVDQATPSKIICRYRNIYFWAGRAPAVGHCGGVGPSCHVRVPHVSLDLRHPRQPIPISCIYCPQRQYLQREGFYADFN